MLTRSEFVEFVRAAKLAVVATANADRHPEAALVGVAATDEGELVFDTRTEARKVANIVRTPRVALVVGWQDDVSIQVEGVADLLSGAERTAYGSDYERQFPGSRALRDEFTIVRVRPQWLRYYDARPESFSIVEGMWN